MKKRRIPILAGFLIIVVIGMMLVSRLWMSPAPIPFEPDSQTLPIRVPLDRNTRTPPASTIMAGDTVIPWVQSSYCWSRGCADYIGGTQMMDGKVPAVVPAGPRIQANYNYEPAPAILVLHQLDNEKNQSNYNDLVSIPLQDGTFTAPTVPGTYYYLLEAHWREKNTQYSDGDTSAVFAIEIR
ncbi:hypothetical protein [Paenibacillus bovis]|uniref:Uncharacterized protein n=1 Tax=Paenibacillus bovis TaxID=1616788 RepID=A0A172ZF12_9BACL|nr:hypothetical protein [Paenibacillus bovis]ANF96225.1 hypothetical protein AR543_09585 [Paenibacillus bovis]